MNIQEQMLKHPSEGGEGFRLTIDYSACEYMKTPPSDSICKLIEESCFTYPGFTLDQYKPTVVIQGVFQPEIQPLQLVLSTCKRCEVGQTATSLLPVAT